MAIAAKYLGFNPSASKEFGDYVSDRSLDNLSKLWKANPGFIAGGLMALEFVFEWGIKALIWNPDFAAKDFMFAKEAGMKDIDLTGTAKTLNKWPGLVYCVLLMTVKYGLINFSARDEYLEAFKAIGGLKETGDLLVRSPGVIGFAIYMFLKFFEEAGAKVLVDPRLQENYTKFWEDATTENAKELFQSGLVAAALTAVGKGIETVWVKGKSGVAGLLDTKRYEGA